VPRRAPAGDLGVEPRCGTPSAQNCSTTSTVSVRWTIDWLLQLAKCAGASGQPGEGPISAAAAGSAHPPPTCCSVCSCF
jgi:hypothetical protein